MPCRTPEAKNTSTGTTNTKTNTNTGTTNTKTNTSTDTTNTKTNTSTQVTIEPLQAYYTRADLVAPNYQDPGTCKADAKLTEISVDPADVTLFMTVQRRIPTFKDIFFATMFMLYLGTYLQEFVVRNDGKLALEQYPKGVILNSPSTFANFESHWNQLLSNSGPITDPVLVDWVNRIKGYITNIENILIILAPTIQRVGDVSLYQTFRVRLADGKHNAECIYRSYYKAAVAQDNTN